MAEDRLLIPIRFGTEGAKGDLKEVESSLESILGVANALGIGGLGALGGLGGIVGAALSGVAADATATATGGLRRGFAATFPATRAAFAEAAVGGTVESRLTPMAEALGLAFPGQPDKIREALRMRIGVETDLERRRAGGRAVLEAELGEQRGEAGAFQRLGVTALMPGLGSLLQALHVLHIDMTEIKLFLSRARRE